VKRARPSPLGSQPPAASWIARGRLWECPACGKTYPRRGQSHACVVVTLDEHFRDRPRARAIFEVFRGAVERVGGPVRLSIARTRIGFIAGGITFASVTPRKERLRAGIVLPRRIDSPRFARVEHFPPWWLHTLDVRDVAEIDAEVERWLRESAAAGRR